MQRVCEDGGKSAPTIIVESIGLAREGVEWKRKNAKLFDWNSEMEAKLVEAPEAESLTRSQPKAVERQITALKKQMGDAELVLEMLAGKTSQTKADF